MLVETIVNVGAIPREKSRRRLLLGQGGGGTLRRAVGPFFAPDKTRHGRVPPPVPRGRTPGGLSPKDRMRRKLQTKRGRQRYALRMETVEPVFGQIKHVRGFRQFLLRGLAKVNREWLLICTGHNLLKLFRFGRRVPGRGWLARVPMVQPLHRQHHVHPGRITHRLTQHPARSAANPQTRCQAMWIVHPRLGGSAGGRAVCFSPAVGNSTKMPGRRRQVPLEAYTSATRRGRSFS